VPAHPNVVFVFADQLRAQSVGFMGNRQVRTPVLDATAAQGIVFDHAVSCCPVCTPYRATLLTGRYPLSNGMVLNDVLLPPDEVSIADVLKRAGYATGYVGKWHLDGPRRGGFTPPGPRRQGFDYWAVANCTHNYMHSHYYRDEPVPIFIEGYDADGHTDLAIEFIRRQSVEKPFCLFVSWGPPHDPYQLMPDEYKVYEPAEVELSPNRTQDTREERGPRGVADSVGCREDIAGYYSHTTALDRCFGRILRALDEAGMSDDTILVFTSDHGDMLGSQGVGKKQRPWDESIRVPFLLRYPRAVPAGRRTPALLNSVDLMQTLLGLAGVEAPATCEGTDLSHVMRGEAGPTPSSAFLQHCCTFADARDVPEWRGIRSKRYTYIRTRSGPWLLYDNQNDPYQLENRASDPTVRALQSELDEELNAWLAHCDDDFAPRDAYWERFGYTVDEWKQAPMTNDLEPTA